MAFQHYILEVLLVQLIGLCWSVETKYLYITATSPGKVIESPRYPLHPSQIREMTWRLEGPFKKRLEINCSVSILKRTDCSEGVLSIGGLRKERVNLCNEISSYRRQSKGNRIDLLFKTSTIEPFKGIGRFRCTVRVVERNKGIDPAADGDNQISCECGKSNDKNKKRIIGGQETAANEYPFMAYLKDKDDEHFIFCGGSIVTSQHILTAAHCVTDKTINLIEVVVGGHNVKTDSTDGVAQKLDVEAYYFTDAGLEGSNDDIALLKLSETIQFNEKISPICLPTDNYLLLNQEVKAIGWGDVGYKGEITDTLHSAELRVAAMARCIKSSNSMNFGVNRASRICTFTDNKDIGHGDSGGPLVYLDPEVNRWVQVGIIVSRKLINGTAIPALHTRVIYFFDWIQETIGRTSELLWRTGINSFLDIPRGLLAIPPPTCEKIEILH